VKAEPSADRWSRFGLSLVWLVAGSGTGALVSGSSGAIVGGLIGLLGGLVTLGFREKSPLPLLLPQSSPLILKAWDPYLRLPRVLRARFDEDLAIFLARKRITGIDMEAGQDLKVFVAASAVTLSVGWPDYNWDQLAEVLIYPQDFDRDYGFDRADLSGLAHPWGTVILSAPALIESFQAPEGDHVGLHEFAHLLDVDQTRFDGIPAGFNTAQAVQWTAVVQKEMERLRRGTSALDPYAAQDPAEFLAVAVEAFFQTPRVIRERHQEVYAILADYFQQDPADWEDAVARPIKRGRP